jgi:hypothetical protein
MFREMRSDGAVQLIGAHYFVGVPTAEGRRHHALHVVEVLLGLERVIDAVVSCLVEFLVAELGIVAKMRAAGRFDQAMGHQRASRNDGIHDTAIDQLGYDQTLLGHGHRAGEGHDHEAFFVARHSLQHVGGFAELAACKRSLRHGAHEVVDGVNLGEIERLQRD